MVIIMKLELIISGSSLTIPVSSPDSVTVSGTFDSLTFTNPYCSETYFVIGEQKNDIKFITVEGSNLEVSKSEPNRVVITGDIKVFRYKNDKGIPLRSYAVLPCDITIAELEEF